MKLSWLQRRVGANCRTRWTSSGPTCRVPKANWRMKLRSIRRLLHSGSTSGLKRNDELTILSPHAIVLRSSLRLPNQHANSWNNASRTSRISSSPPRSAYRLSSHRPTARAKSRILSAVRNSWPNKFQISSARFSARRRTLKLLLLRLPVSKISHRTPKTDYRLSSKPTNDSRSNSILHKKRRTQLSATFSSVLRTSHLSLLPVAPNSLN